MALALQKTDSAPEQSWSRDLVDVLDTGAELRLNNSSLRGAPETPTREPGPFVAAPLGMIPPVHNLQDSFAGLG